ncbi:hypothetical protein [Maribellus sediminis]|uniref:hypothetical protein n=1 Tax=Maribellus sediminis TaxID=2696285 RepID=UPI00143179BD|nr:hypothetical protein [Maribellus sediminis]
MRKVFLVFAFLQTLTTVNAQNPSSGIIFGINAGASKMMSEVSSGFSESYKEFDQSAGFASDLELSKLFLNHFEVGASIGMTNLHGTLDDPTQSVNKYKIQGDYYIRDLEGPLQYNNRLIGQRFFVGYYFRSFENISDVYSPEPFIRIGAGYINYAVELFENETSSSGKGTGDYADLPMSSALFFATAGVKSYISPNLFANITYTFNYTGYDYLDAVFNFNSAGERLGLGGIYSELKVGLFYQFAGKSKHKGSAKNGLGPNLPFSK